MLEQLAGAEVEPITEEPFGVGRHEFLMGNALERGNLLGAGRAATCGHVRFLIPRQNRRRAIDALDLQELFGKWFEGFQSFHSTRALAAHGHDMIVLGLMIQFTHLMPDYQTLEENGHEDVSFRRD